MTRFVCAIYRADRGDRIRRVRLVGRETDESWTPTESESDDPVAVAEAAAAWTSSRLQARGMKSLATVCVDADGSVCGWVRPVNPDPRAVLAVAQRSGGEALVSGAEQAYDADNGAAGQMLSPSIDTPGSGELQAVIEPSARGASVEGASVSRVPVIAVRDASVQLFLTFLDGAGVTVGRVQGFWHALSLAWGIHPESPEQAPDEAVVAEQSPLSSVVVVDRACRLVWAWCDDRGLVAAGSILLVHHGAEPVCEPGDVARLASDWLAWGAQLGRAPSRIVLVTPDTLGEEGGLAPQDFGREIARRWSSATVDAAAYEDPMRETLARVLDPGPRPRREVSLDPGVASARRSMVLAVALVAIAAGATGTLMIREAIASSSIQQREFGILGGVLLLATTLLAVWMGARWLRLARRPEEEDAEVMDPRRALVGLSTQPGRKHRAAYRWGGVSLALLGVVAGVFGWRMHARAEEAAQIAATFESKTSRLYLEQGLEPASGGRAVLNMESYLATERQKHATPADVPDPLPILQSLDSIMLVLGTVEPEQTELRSIEVHPVRVQITVRVPDLEPFVAVRESLRDVDSPLTNWTSRQEEVQTREGGETRTVIEAVYTAEWSD